MSCIDVVETNVVEWVQEYQGPKFHALLTDAPYHLPSMTKRFGKSGSAPARPGRDGAFQRYSCGFIGKGWDGGDVAFQPATWAGLAEHLHPGAFSMAFGGSQTWHRLAVAIEEGRQELHPSMYWAYGTGLPKPKPVKAPAFGGHRYGRQAIKPAVEPIAVFQRPYQGRPRDCIARTGAGALNIDGARIWANGAPGYWPANLILQHEPGCNGTCVDGCPVKQMGAGARFFYQADWNYEIMEGLIEATPVIYQAKPDRAEKRAGLGRKNPHPTVKPIELARHLATLLLPPAEYAPRRILVPFSGSGSELIGAALAGWEEVVGIEWDAEYINITQTRLEHYGYWEKESSDERLNLC